MDGLDIKIIDLSFLLKNRIFRIDSTFYDKTACEYDNKIQSMKHFYFPEKDVVSGPFGSSLTSDAYQNEGIPFIRISDIKGGFTINSTDMIYISEKDNERLKSSQLTLNDIILSKVGNSVGYYARVDEKIQNCNISENNIGIKLHNLKLTDEQKHYILVYLNSKYGNVLTLRRSSGNAQPKLNVFDVAEIPVPCVSNEFATCISSALMDAQNILELSNTKYKQVEEDLLGEIGINMSTIHSGGVSIKSYAESFGDSGRLDAEYYQPKYDILMDSILKVKHEKLSRIAYINKSIEPGSDAYRDSGIPFVRISDISKFGISKTDKYLEPKGKYDLPDFYLKENEILFSKDGSVGIAYKMEHDANMISSSALLHLTIKDENEILPDYLTAVLNSKIVQLQAERDSGGSIIKHWKPTEIEDVLIPIIDKDIQKEFSSKVINSFKLRRLSEQILECATMAVEIAIEQNENVAIDWLNKRLEEIKTKM